MDITKLFGLLVRIHRKVSGQGIVGVAGTHQIERNRGELHGCTTLQEKHFIVFRNTHHATQRGFRRLDNGVIHLRSVTHLHNGHA